MKQFYAIIIFLLFSATVSAQAPSGFKYQAVLRDARGNTKANTKVTIIIDILQGSTSGIKVYSETHNVTTDTYGLINLEIGKGTSTLGSISGIDWSEGPYFIRVTVDGIEMGTNQLLSVPYALYAKSAGNGFSGSYNDLTAKPLLFDGTWASLTGKPVFATVSTSGSYNDLTNKPVIFSGAWASLTGKPTYATVASTGSYNDLLNKPIIFNGTWTSLTGKPSTIAGYGITDAVTITGDQTIAGNKTLSDRLSVMGNTSVGTATPETSAVLDVSSTSQGFLPPRMTYVQKSAIASPVAGLVVWCSNCGNSGELQVYNGTVWTNMIGGTATASLPVIATNETVTLVTQTSATIGGNITSDGGSPVTSRGVCWNITGNPTILLSTKTTDGTGTGVFISSVTGLTAGATYYVRAYATSSLGTSYGSSTLFTTLSPAIMVTDIDGNVYNTVNIGQQIWMTENMKTTKYSDGTIIPLVNNQTIWDALTETSKAYCWYADDISNKDTYGALYSWSAAMNGSSSSTANPSGVQGVCPTGWHLPSDAEWSQLESFLGTNAGGKLKEINTTHWRTPNAGATNESGFIGLPGGNRHIDGVFYDIGSYGYWWSATAINSTRANNRALYYYLTNLGKDFQDDKVYGYSVRCIKNN